MSDHESLVRNHMKLLAAGDVDAIMSDFAGDAVMAAFGREYEGTDAIRGFFGKTIERTAPGATYEIQSLDVQGDEVEITWNLLVPGGDAPVASGGDRFWIEDGNFVRQSVWVGPKPE